MGFSEQVQRVRKFCFSKPLQEVVQVVLVVRVLVVLVLLVRVVHLVLLVLVVPFAVLVPFLVLVILVVRVVLAVRIVPGLHVVLVVRLVLVFHVVNANLHTRESGTLCQGEDLCSNWGNKNPFSFSTREKEGKPFVLFATSEVGGKEEYNCPVASVVLVWNVAHYCKE